MIKKLRKRLTIIFTTITSTVLIAVLALALWYNFSQLEMNNLKDFTSNVNYVAMSLSNNGIDTKWLTEMEEQNQLIISAEKDGEAIIFDSGYAKTETREIAIEKAEDVLSEQTVLQTACYPSVASAFSGFATSTYKTYVIRLEEDENEEIDISYFFDDGYFENAEIIITNENEDGDTFQQSFMDAEEYDRIKEEIKDFEIAEGDNSLEETVVVKAMPITDEIMSLEAVDYGISIEAEAVPATHLIESNSISLNDSHIDFKTDKNDAYRMQSLSYTQGDSEYDLVILSDKSKENHSKLLLFFSYAGLAILGVIILSIVNWFLSKIIVKPTEDGLKKQAEFVAAASHELRNPLAVIRGSIEAGSICEDEEESQKYYSNAKEETTRMNRLVNDLLMLAGNDSNRWSLIKEPFDIDTMLIEISEQYIPIATKRGKSLRLDLPDEALGEITGDNVRVRQIISVFIDNAISHSKDNEEIVLTAYKKKHKLYVSVIDHGSGISKEDKERIFDRFFRADNSRSDKKHFGLGLSIARDLAKLHGGTVSVEDTEGGGSTFTLMLPEKSK